MRLVQCRLRSKKIDFWSAILTLTVLLASSGLSIGAQALSSSEVSGVGFPVEILSPVPTSDVAWLNKEYVPKSIKRIKKHWYRLIPNEVRAPQDKPGLARVQFVIQPDGRLSDEKLERSSGDAAMDRAALHAIQQASPFPSFGRKRKVKYLRLRIVFLYNITPEGETN